MHRYQSGIALITVLLILSLATVAAVAMTTRQQLDIRRTTNILKIEEGYVALLAAEEFAKRLLLADFREIPGLSNRINTTTDGFGDIWYNPHLGSAKQEIGNFTVTNFKFIDLQGRFNINNLLDANQALSQNDYAAFQRLLDNNALPRSLTDVALDWMDANTDAVNNNGAEDSAYQSLAKPYIPPNQPMTSASEMFRLMGVNLAGSDDSDRSNKKRREIIGNLLHEENNEALTALPGRTTINVNTVSSPAVYQSIVPGLAFDDAEALVGLTNIAPGKAPPFENADDFWNEPAVKPLLAKIAQNQRIQIGVTSEYFLFQAEAISGDLVVYSNTIFHRTASPPSVEVIHRSYGKKGEI